jgi:methionyl-tRNA formyltransferase
MRILYLGPLHKEMAGFIATGGDEVVQTEESVQPGDAQLGAADFIVSYGYRHLLRREIVAQFAKRAVNLHISLLPWNRGADPNLWSFLEDTPKGVTIHYIDSGIDTGDVVAQRAVEHLSMDTLRTSYLRLEREIERLFRECWPRLREGKVDASRQRPGGSFHRTADRAAVQHLLVQGWDTPVANLIGRAQREGLKT